MRFILPSARMENVWRTARGKMVIGTFLSAISKPDKLSASPTRLNTKALPPGRRMVNGWLTTPTVNNNLDIFVLSLSNRDQAHIKLTDDQAADSSPAWSPGGRQIAFVSNRGGEADIWLADLDRTEGRFSNLSQKSDATDTHPVWSPDGVHLAWASEQSGEHRLMVWSGEPIQPASIMAAQTGYGDWPAWSPQSDLLFGGVRHPNQHILAAFALGSGLQRMPPIDLPGEIYGMEWKSGPLSGWLWDAVNRADTSTYSVMAQPVLSLFPGSPQGRMSMVKIDDVSAPQAMIHDAVDEAFLALRQEAADASGWDVLSSLENAYIPLTSPPEPSLYDDWLYTGRAFLVEPFNPVCRLDGSRA